MAQKEMAHIWKVLEMKAVEPKMCRVPVMCVPGSCVGSLYVINIYYYLLTITVPNRYGILLQI